MTSFSASPKIIGAQHPLQTDLVQIAGALQARGCSVFCIGRFAVSAEAEDAVYQALVREKETGDLALVAELCVPMPPIFFS